MDQEGNSETDTVSKDSQVSYRILYSVGEAYKAALKWFPAGSSDPVDYQGGRDLDSLAKLYAVFILLVKELTPALLRNLVRSPRSSPLLLLLPSRLLLATLTMSS